MWLRVWVWDVGYGHRRIGYALVIVCAWSSSSPRFHVTWSPCLDNNMLSYFITSKSRWWGGVIFFLRVLHCVLTNYNGSIIAFLLTIILLSVDFFSFPFLKFMWHVIVFKSLSSLKKKLLWYYKICNSYEPWVVCFLWL